MLSKKHPTNPRFMDDALNRKGIKYLNVETGLLPPPIKMSDYALASNPVYQLWWRVFKKLHTT